MALVVAQAVPTSSSMAVPHGPMGVGEARQRMREQLNRSGVSASVVDDAVLILSELLSNSCRHGRPLSRAEREDGEVRAAWRLDRLGALTVEVTDGGGPTRPAPGTPSVTARGGRGLTIIGALAQEWGVRDGASGEVTVWVLVTGGGVTEDGATRVDAGDPGRTGAVVDAVGAVDGSVPAPDGRGHGHDRRAGRTGRPPGVPAPRRTAPGAA